MATEDKSARPIEAPDNSQAVIADTAGAKPVAWKVVWPNGIYDLFAYEHDAMADAEIHRGTVIPLYTAPAPLSDTAGAKTYSGFCAAFFASNRRNATEQEIFDAGVRAGIARVSTAIDAAPQPMTKQELDALPDWVKNAKPPEAP